MQACPFPRWISAIIVSGLCLLPGVASLEGQREGQKDESQDSQKAEKPRRPKVTLKAQPTAGRAPLRVVFSAELTGGDDDFEEYYCPTILWEWSKGNASESTSDCAPYEAGKSTIRRRYTVEHTFRNYGTFRVYFNLIHRDREVGNASINVVVQPGGSGSFDPEG